MPPLQQQQAVVAAMADLTMEETSEVSQSPVQENASPSAEKTAARSVQAEAISQAGESIADAPSKAHNEETPKKSPLQGSQISNTPSLQDPRKASKGTHHHFCHKRKLEGHLGHGKQVLRLPGEAKATELPSHVSKGILTS